MTGAGWVVVGNPGHRRVRLFADAVRAAGLPPPDVLPWRDVLTGSVSVPDGALVRVDSSGEDEEVNRLLRGPRADPHRVGGGGAWYRAFTEGLRRLGSAVAAADGAVLLSDPAEVATMFDKRRCHAVLDAAGLPVPPALPEVRGYEELRQRMAEAAWGRVFLKPAHGSSASGVVALTAAGRRVTATTSAQVSPDGALYNSLRVNTYSDEDVVRALVDTVCADPVHVERWLPKASLGGRTMDLRVVVVAGQVTHAVVRTSRHPMTNLHLGGARVDVADLRAVLGEPGWRRIVATCERVAAVFGRTVMVGVDVLLVIGHRRHAVAEVNAFGDLLPGLTGLPDGPAAGVDTYAAQVAAYQALAGATQRRVPCLT